MSSARCPGWCSGSSRGCPAPSWTAACPDQTARRNLITQTLVSGGDGYCLHSTLQASSQARDLLRDGTTITGVIDIQPPVLAGDRAFDLATLLFYHYDCEQVRELLRARLLALAGPEAAFAYLAHMVLRQTDWSLRHYPAAATTRRHLNLARAVTTDITDTLPH